MSGNTVSESILDAISSSLAGDWKRFGRLMSLEEAHIECIDLENSSVYEKCRTVLTKCIHIQPNLKFSDLKEVLRKIDRNDVIKKCDALSVLLSENVAGTQFTDAIGRLRSRYIQQYTVLFDEPSNNMSPRNLDRMSAFVDLAVTSLRDVHEYWNNNSDRNYHFNQHLFKGQTVTIKDIMTETERLVCLGGVAGSGKSTLLLYLVLKWANQELWVNDNGPQCDFVFLLLCREINYLDSCSSLESLLKFLYPEVFQLVSFEDLQNIADRVLIIIDGIDEFVGLNDIVSQSYGKVHVANISKCLYQAANPVHSSLFGHKVLISGRPEGISMIQKRFQKVVNLKSIEVMGFNPENVKVYIRNSFPTDDEKYETLMNKLESSPNLSLMASLPVYLSIICHLFQNEAKMSVDTSVELYSWALGLYLKNHFHADGVFYMTLGDLFKQENVRRALVVVTEMAYKMLCNGTVVFDADSLPGVFEESLEYCGLVTKVFSGEFTVKYQFRHLSLQEFCAAAHILRKGIPREGIIQNFRLRGCIPVLCGLESAIIPGCHSSSIVKAIVNALNVKTLIERPTINYLVKDLFGNKSQQCVLTGSNDAWNMVAAAYYEHHNPLDDSSISLIRDNEIILYLKNFSLVQMTFMTYFFDQLISQHFPVKEIYLQVVPNSKDGHKKLAQYICLAERVHFENTYAFTRQNLSIVNTEFENFIQTDVNPRIKDLRLYGCDVSSQLLMSLTSVLSNLHTLVLSYNKNILIDGWKLITDLFNNEKCCLKKLHVRDCNIRDAEFRILAPIVPKLREFEICDNPGISVDVWKFFAVCANRENLLIKFHARCCYLTDEIIAVLIPFFMKLEELDIGFNKAITSFGWEKILYFVKQREHMAQPVKRLSIKSCCIDKCHIEELRPAVAILETLVSRPNVLNHQQEGLDNIKLELIKINCDLNDDNMKQFCSKIESFERIDLSYNTGIGTNGWKCFVDLLQHKSKLKELVLCDCELNDECMSILSELFPRLTELRLSGNSGITNVGWKTLSSAAIHCHGQHLQEVNLRSCKLNNVSFRMLSPIFGHLKYLSVKNNPDVTKIGWKYFVEAVIGSQKIVLKYLNISDCHLQDASLEVLLPILSFLHTLKIGGNMKISSSGWKRLGNVGNNSDCQLRELFAFRCLLTDKDVTMIMPLILTLQRLDVRFNKCITNAAWKLLAEKLNEHAASNLECIDLYDCVISYADLKSLTEVVKYVNV